MLGSIPQYHYHHIKQLTKTSVWACACADTYAKRIKICFWARRIIKLTESKTHTYLHSESESIGADLQREFRVNLYSPEVENRNIPTFLPLACTRKLARFCLSHTMHDEHLQWVESAFCFIHWVCSRSPVISALSLVLSLALSSEKNPLFIPSFVEAFLEPNIQFSHARVTQNCWHIFQLFSEI